MAETKQARQVRLTKEGRFADYARRRSELESQPRAEGVDDKVWRRSIDLKLNDEFGPGSIERMKQNAAANRLEDWREFARRIPTKRRARQVENFEWAMEHIASVAADVAIEDVPSRAAVFLLVEALESPEGKRKFLELYQRATAPRGGQTPTEWADEEIKRFDWLKGMMKEFRDRLKVEHEEFIARNGLPAPNPVSRTEGGAGDAMLAAAEANMVAEARGNMARQAAIDEAPRELPREVVKIGHQVVEVDVAEDSTAETESSYLESPA